MSAYKGERKRLTIRLPATLVRRLAWLAATKGVPLNELLVELLWKEIK